MTRVKVSLVAAAGMSAVICSAGAVRAADMPAPPPPPMVYVPPVQEFSGWYLRGDIGMTNQQAKSAENVQIATASGFTWLDQMSFDSGMLFGLGVGYLYNNWLRFDVTGEYRGKTAMRGLDHYVSGGTTFTNNYSGNKSEWLFLANAYADLGTWWCITPFIGAGVGVANVKISSFRDDNIIAGGGGYADSATQTNFAWALHAGVGYQVTQNFTVELAYRYVNLGDGITGDVINYNGTNTLNNPWTLKSLSSHDVKLGLRWVCCDDRSLAQTAAYRPSYVPPAPIASQQVLVAPPPAPAPVYQQQYAAPPAYQQQPYQQQYAPPAQNYYAPAPLMRKG